MRHGLRIALVVLCVLGLSACVVVRAEPVEPEALEPLARADDHDYE